MGNPAIFQNWQKAMEIDISSGKHNTSIVGEE